MTSAKIVSRMSSRRVIYPAIIGDILIAVTKFVAAGLTGSSAMLTGPVTGLMAGMSGQVLINPPAKEN